MASSRTRKIVMTGILGAISIILGITRIGLIPLPFLGISLTILHIPVIIGAVLEGPWVGMGIGLIFGTVSLILAGQPNSMFDPLFTNPLISIFPRLIIGPVAWFIYKIFNKREVVALIISGIAGSLTNTIFVLGMIGILGMVGVTSKIPWPLLGTIALTNGLPEAIAAAILVLIIVGAWKRIPLSNKKGSSLD
jgi:uncharacterized membrane protein